jgi:hypothetical protein
VPEQVGQVERINATPSDLPFKSTGFATYPVPPQLGQRSEFTPLPPQVDEIVYEECEEIATKLFPLRNANKNPHGMGA